MAKIDDGNLVHNASSHQENSNYGSEFTITVSKENNKISESLLTAICEELTKVHKRYKKITKSPRREIRSVGNTESY